MGKKIKIKVRDLNAWYGDKQALFNINLDICENEIVSLIGPSGCGKSTFLRQLNRMNDVIESYSWKGSVILDELDIASKNVDTVQLRSRVGMVFQKPNPFPKSIYDNVAYGPVIHGLHESKSELDDIVITCLKRAGLFKEVSNRIHESATSLSGGQQQRLCIARAMAIEPEVILMDEPCSALDPIATAHIEELLNELKEQYTIVIVTHSMHQAARISKKTAFFNLGKLIEVNDTKKIFNNPDKIQTLHYITGRYG